MSGGVDSSLAAALLVEQGYEVIGVTLQLGPDEGGSSQRGCCSLSAVEDARRVAGKLGIPYYVLNFRDIFAETVIADFVREYRRGRTPNPCVRCNQHVKFAALRQRARQLGAEFLATGHYARVSTDPESGRYLLLRGVDAAKDQSYALYTLTQEQLASTLFPLGGMTKAETRCRAAALGLGVATKRDSQEICFVPEDDYAGFLRRREPAVATPGPIVDQQGNVLGEHPGIAFFTLGQKRGLRLPVPHPLYVLEIRPETNTLVVGPEEALRQRACVVTDLNWISVAAPQVELEVTAKVRYNMEDQAAVVRPLAEDQAQLVFDEPQRAITPGQAAVFYQGDRVVGGGTVQSLRLAEAQTG
jgi:tRNA-specific 2-thiouridylase